MITRSVVFSKRSKVLKPYHVAKNIDFIRKYTWKEWLRYGSAYYLGMPSQIVWSEFSVRLAHKYDQTDPVKWTLVYNDVGHGRIRVLIVLGVFGSIMSVMRLARDYYENGKFTLDAAKKFQRDLDTVGWFKYVFFLLLANSFFWVFRAMSVRVLRIYQSAEQPHMFKVVRNFMGLVKYNVNVQHGETKSLKRLYVAETYSNPLVLHARLVLFGNAQIKGRPVILDPNLFKDNQLCTYFLSVTDKPPGQESSPSKFAKKGMIRPF